MKFITTLLCIISLSANAQDLLNAKDLKLFVGKWNGTLEYTDYRDDKTMVMQTRLEIKAAADSMVLQFSYTEPGGRLVQEREVWKIVSNGEQLQLGKDVSDISNINRELGNIILTLDRNGMDNDKPSVIRKMITISNQNLSIVKRVKYDGSDAYLLRNTYTFRKS
jgi:hypothetical protein